MLGQRWSRWWWSRWGTRWRISRRSIQVGEVHKTSSCFLVKLLLRYFLSRKCRFRSMKKMKNLRSEPTPALLRVKKYFSWGGPFRCSRFLCCVLLALSWNTNENLSSDKLSWTINYFRWGRSGGRGSSSGRPAPPPRPFGPTKPNFVSSVGETFSTFHHGHISAKLG